MASVGARAVPHSPQNFAAGLLDEPHAGQARASEEPHSRQNLRPASFSAPHTEQRTGHPPGGNSRPEGYWVPVVRYRANATSTHS